MKKNLSVLNRHAERIINLPNVVGVNIGFKMRAGELSNEYVIVALVVKKTFP